MKVKENLFNPPEHVKVKMLKFFVRTSLPRALEEKQRKLQDESK